MSSSDLRSARVAVGRASGLLQSDGFSSSEARHALRQGERLHRVSVYPSDFGLERMAEEARLGRARCSAAPVPAQLLRPAPAMAADPAALRPSPRQTMMTRLQALASDCTCPAAALERSSEQ